ncbi:SDR family oxidoreductase [Leptospira meyeri]|uniref:SDR family oxidoreductase n=1 Tax=Leptospira meyeri TaxID=29508 RepID=UPI001082E9F6|nr:SDR family oxidoreductase [Leptospira meyeri]TGL10755.1 SDR family oxidoreductase [Leptospira meyeri]
MDRLYSLKDKVIIITGATGLLGSQHAEVVAEAGGIPVLLDLDQEKCSQLAKELKQKYSVDAVGYKVDITNEKEIIDNCAILKEKFKSVHALINNAANNPKVEDSSEKAFSRLENFPISIWNSDLAVGLTGSFLCSKHFGFLIAQNVEGGTILNISSDLGLIAPDQRLYKKTGLADELQPVKPVTYSVVKAGLIGLTRYLATYWADKNVRCNAICPGGVENNQNVDFLKEVTSRIPLGRMAKKDEYQGLVLFLLSDSASYLNGSIISADGGRSVW